ncbi:hypothetical protein QCA50_007811 [Cerrena zonata]|uniref:ATP synthase mitochondrial F1 complex assembly factor 2 n=1 Tax=Cerrena zonata TaxID=2478898 RepID=A0AAW0GD95_9APHY
MASIARTYARRITSTSCRSLLSQSCSPRHSRLLVNTHQRRTQATVAETGEAKTATNRKRRSVCRRALPADQSLPPSTIPSSHVWCTDSYSHTGAQATLKRFWKSVDLAHPSEDPSKGYVVRLDKRSLKTPAGNPLILPKEKKLAATLVVSEWENQEQALKQHSLPMTSLVSRAIDAFGDEATKAEVREKLLQYFGTDTICFYADQPKSLVELERIHWDPLHAWVQKEYNVTINKTDSGFSIPKQDPKTYEVFDETMKSFNQWEMAALERIVYSSKSFIIGLALVKKQISADQAAEASHVEVNSQIKGWGMVEDSHDVDYHDIRRQLASAAVLLADI